MSIYDPLSFYVKYYVMLCQHYTNTSCVKVLYQYHIIIFTMSMINNMSILCEHCIHFLSIFCQVCLLCHTIIHYVLLCHMSIV